MVILQKTPANEGGYIEGNMAYLQKWGEKINTRDLPLTGELLVADGCSPCPNFRPAEVILTLVAMFNVAPSVLIRTFLGSSGTYEEYGKIWGLSQRANQTWIDFYAGIPSIDNVDPKFLPIGHDVQKATEIRTKCIQEMWKLISPYIGTGTAKLKISVMENEYSRTLKIADIIDSMPLNALLMKFPCPICSHQTDKTLYHGLRRTKDNFCVTKNERSEAEVKCMCAQPWKKHGMKLRVADASSMLGARLSGKLIYSLLSLQLPKLVIRDYSNPRGTVAQVVNDWDENIWISTRLEIPGNSLELQDSIRNSPGEWADILKKVSFLCSGEEICITY